jgi:UDP-N-acetylglucosamine--N-acetylmuramyl-(pentapeptide) pyrophosphoryl-undecaprenol N-acetylglucosamine transferase
VLRRDLWAMFHALADAGAAVHLPQSELSADRLGREVRALIENPSRMDALTRAAAQRARPDAANEIARRIVSLLPPGKG